MDLLILKKLKKQTQQAAFFILVILLASSLSFAQNFAAQNPVADATVSDFTQLPTATYLRPEMPQDMYTNLVHIFSTLNLFVIEGGIQFTHCTEISSGEVYESFRSCLFKETPFFKEQEKTVVVHAELGHSGITFDFVLTFDRISKFLLLMSHIDPRSSSYEVSIQVVSPQTLSHVIESLLNSPEMENIKEELASVYSFHPDTVRIHIQPHKKDIRMIRFNFVRNTHTVYDATIITDYSLDGSDNYFVELAQF